MSRFTVGDWFGIGTQNNRERNIQVDEDESFGMGEGEESGII